MNEGANTLVDTYMKAQLIDYVITFLGFLGGFFWIIQDENGGSS